MATESGIYEITNKINGNRYVGSTVNLKSRWYRHKSKLRKGTHENGHLQNAWNKYGEVSFVFAPVFYCGEESLLELEQMALDTINPEYNICGVAGSSLGVTRSVEHRAKLSASLIGNTNACGYNRTAEHRAKLSAAMIGKKNALGHRHTDEARIKISVAKRGKPWTKNQRDARGAQGSIDD